MYPEDMAFGAPTFPAQYVSSEIALHPFAYPTYALESAQSVCSMPTLQYDYSQAQCHPSFRTAKPRNEHVCPQEAKGVCKVRKCCGSAGPRASHFIVLGSLSIANLFVIASFKRVTYLLCKYMVTVCRHPGRSHYWWLCANFVPAGI